MAPQQRPDKDKRLVSILSFANDLEAQLATASMKPQGPLFNEVEKHISNFPNPKSLGQSAIFKCEEIDSNGTSLWNLCTRLRRNFDSENLQDVPLILIITRVFAFLLLDCALDCGKGTTSNVLRLMKIGLKAGRNCVERKHFDLALKVLEKVGSYELMLRKPDAGISSEDMEVHERFIAEYYVLRTALAWNQDQLEMAEHMFNKSISAQRFFDSRTGESLADVLFELGKDLLNKQQYQLAVKWLDRSYDVLNNQELDRVSSDASELRMSIMEAYVKSLIGLKEAPAADKARSLVELLENEVGDKLIVLLLRLELLCTANEENFDNNAYSDILNRMIRSILLSEGTFKLVMHHIRKLNDKSPSLACKALDDFLRLRILRSEQDGWIEKVLITRLWMVRGQRDSPDALLSLETTLSNIGSNISKPLSSAVTLAAHTLLWKQIESNYTQGRYDSAEQWCRLAIHQIFETSGDLNMARISRKRLLCAIAKQDFAVARDIFGSMSDLAKNEPMTRFLMYKIAIRSGDFGFAAECLQIVSSSSIKDATLLHACVLDAQQVGDKTQAVVALQLVLERQSEGASGNVNLPSLLRTTIRFTSSLLDDSKTAGGSEDALANAEKICALFEGAVRSMRKASLPGEAVEIVWTIPELDWFSKNSYNLAIKNISVWEPQNLLRMLMCCISFIDQYPPDIGQQVSEDLSLRKMFCEFSAATALVTLARGEDIIEDQLQYFLDLRKHVDSYDTLLQDKIGKIEEGPAEDLLQKLSVLIGFDFEAACQLKSWDSLEETILKAEVCKNPRVYEIMADCILSSQAPTLALVTTLKKIVNHAWELESLDSIKLAKYMRCLFQVALTDSPNIAEGLLDQICSLAEESSETELPYPAEELEWIATRAFNHAVDLYCNDQDEACRNWAHKALHIAHFCTDGGALEKLLQNKLMGLKFDN